MNSVMKNAIPKISKTLYSKTYFTHNSTLSGPNVDVSLGQRTGE